MSWNWLNFMKYGFIATYYDIIGKDSIAKNYWFLSGENLRRFEK